MSDQTDAIIKEAAKMYRGIVRDVLVQQAARGEIPCAQIGMWADMAETKFAAELFKRTRDER